MSKAAENAVWWTAWAAAAGCFAWAYVIGHVGVLLVSWWAAVAAVGVYRVCRKRRKEAECGL